MNFTATVKSEGSRDSLPREIQLQLDAAEGWLMLRNPSAAAEELEKIHTDYYYDARVLSVRWQIYAVARWWEAAWIVAAALCEIAPDFPTGWICQANALREYKGLKPAKKLLLSVVERFPDEAVIPYNLSCYSCQLGQLGEACKWLLKAFDIEKTVQLKLMALCDSDLKPLWEKIAESALSSVAEKANQPEQAPD